MIRRDSYFNIINEFIDTNFIKIFTGIRRSGKTTLLHSIVDELKSKGIPSDNIFYISFESMEYQNIEDSIQLNNLIIKLIEEVDGKYYFFFDEIQLVKNWEKSINGFHTDLNCDIYITSSNAMLLSGEYATLLSGRYKQINVYPFSFKEVLKYKREIDSIEITDDIQKKIFDEYLEFGGMPGILELRSAKAKKDALNDIYASIVYNDIFGRYIIKKTDLFKRFSNYIMNTMGETFSSKSITNYLKNEVEETTRNTILNFTNYLENAYFIHKVRREDLIGKKLLKTRQKYYLTDHGFHNAVIQSNWIKQSPVLENIVYMELLRRGYEVKIGKIYDKEIDFLCEKDGDKCYIQVCYLLSNPETIEREFNPLLKVKDQYDKYVFSMDEHDNSHEGIKHVNIIDFLTNDTF
ncbi:MAG: ATP-binding protein [Methanosphaera stadtmanae]|nr:ATP-binding protein [Methanosphaera stadtmanae]